MEPFVPSKNGLELSKELEKGELYPLSFLFGPEEKKIRNGKKREEVKKERRELGSFPFQICIRACCMEKPSKRGRERRGGGG